MTNQPRGHSPDAPHRRRAHTTTAAQLDEFCKQGCSDPRCTTPPELHEELYITSKCHPNEPAVFAFYDRISKEVCFECTACHKGIIKVRVR